MFRSHSSVGLPLLPLACAAMLVSGTASAALSDTIHPFVSIGYTYDDNLLRLPDDYLGIMERSDRATQAQAGVLLERPIGRQKLTGSAKVTRVTFDRFDQLDYNGKDFTADLAWQLGNRWSGTLGANYNETLTPFSDTITDQRNLRTTRKGYASANWRFHPSWRLRGSFTRYEYEYELRVQQVNNRTEDMAEFGGDYLAASGSTIGLVARQWKGSYDNPRRINGIAIDDDYKQKELKANVNWLLSGITRVQILAGYAKREHTFFTIRDSSGFNGRATVNWAPLNKVRFTAEAWREFAAVESFVVSNSLNKGASVGAVWDATGKIQVTANARTLSRRFELLDATATSGEPKDRLRSAQLGLTYAPTLSTQISLSAFREKRDGSAQIGTGDYRAKGVSLNATAQF